MNSWKLDNIETRWPARTVYIEVDKDLSICFSCDQSAHCAKFSLCCEEYYREANGLDKQDTGLRIPSIKWLKRVNEGLE